MPVTSNDAIWPQLPYEHWEPTKQTVHRYAQIVGKVRMALVPFRNHWWHVTLYVSARGLTTGPMPCGDLTAEIEFDFIEHRLEVRTSQGRAAGFDLRERPACADFFSQLFATLAAVGVHVTIHPKPFDLGDSPPFESDTINHSYDPDAVARWWTILRLIDGVLARFGSSFAGKASPIGPVSHSFAARTGSWRWRPGSWWRQGSRPTGSAPSASAPAHKASPAGADAWQHARRVMLGPWTSSPSWIRSRSW